MPGKALAVAVKSPRATGLLSGLISSTSAGMLLTHWFTELLVHWNVPGYSLMYVMPPGPIPKGWAVQE